MATAAKQWVGQLVDGKFRLGDFVGANERSAVFLTEYEAPGVRKAAIKLVAAEGSEAVGLLGRWRHAAELSHPHLIRILASGRCEFNSTPILYVVMEYAEENLSTVLARRPLGPAEARSILNPVVDALSYIHAKGFVHTRIKPGNILAEEDLLKISSDGLCRIGESSGALGQPGAYDPPEAAGGRISPAGDVWSLGMTLCEALTQRLASWERTNQHEPAIPSGVPAEFADIARHCLRRDPQLRWSIADIAARLHPNAPPAPKPILPNPPSNFEARRYVVPALIAFFLVAVTFVCVHIYNHRAHPQSAQTHAALERPALAPDTMPPPKPNPTPTKKSATLPPAPITKPAPQPPAANSAPKPASVALAPKSVPATTSNPSAKSASATTPNPPAAKSATAMVPQPTPPPANSKSPAVIATIPPPAKSKSPAANTPAPSTVKSTTPAATAPPTQTPAGPAAPATSGAVPGKVLQQVLPNAAATARATIRGTVRVTIKIHADASGQVTDASIDSRGPSQFFADRSLQAARLWKFSPPQQNAHAVPSDWLIHFEIDPATINVHATQTNP
jgi:eukaryotic-like serine/threonine-protein kinase